MRAFPDLGLLLALALASIAAACGPDAAPPSGTTPAATPPAAPTAPASTTAAPLRVFDCGEGVVLLVREGAGGALDVAWADRRETLARAGDEGSEGDAEVHSGAGVSLALSGDEGTFTVGEEPALACRRGERARSIERAAAAGAVVWAVGNEPGWNLELYPDRLVFVGNYGETRAEGPVVEVTDVDGYRAYRGLAAGVEILARVQRGLCRDVMSGAPFATEVYVTHAGDTVRGCGVLLVEPSRPE